VPSWSKSMREFLRWGGGYTAGREGAIWGGDVREVRLRPEGPGIVAALRLHVGWISRVARACVGNEAGRRKRVKLQSHFVASPVGWILCFFSDLLFGTMQRLHAICDGAPLPGGHA
jgi:hypothetical protein